ncbi:helix-turn-helix transcriptional regulator [Pseudomonas sp. BLCC-B112]|uniref:helix-turn-helix transcriptional regulator n=1 Tax=Pseudomonas sp. BLCC-B112 TaxID=3025319 RepID=UPI00234D17BC|nr:AlpA family phage regulatory protein [Pseudomonas sp. BLCC-B112]MDC7818294.1 AlpA family phage regulatory protein [Pseudomonas sp. BLCC-B112]
MSELKDQVLLEPANIIIRMPEVEKITGLARSTIYKRLKADPTFPRPVPLSNANTRGSPVGFVLAEVQEWVGQRMTMRGASSAHRDFESI